MADLGQNAGHCYVNLAPSVTGKLSRIHRGFAPACLQCVAQCCHVKLFSEFEFAANLAGRKSILGHRSPSREEKPQQRNQRKRPGPVADLRHALGGQIGQHTVNSDARKQQRQRSENSKQQQKKSLARERVTGKLLQRLDFIKDLVPCNSADFASA